MRNVKAHEPVAHPRPRRSRCQGAGRAAESCKDGTTADPRPPGLAADPGPPRVAAGAGAKIASFSTLGPAAAGEYWFTRL